MFRFEHPYYLYALEILPILGVFFYLMLQARKRAMQRFANAELFKKIAPQRSRYKHAVKFWLFLLGITFLIFGAANPQWGLEKKTIKRKGVDVFIALDVSNSMLVEDVAPNRLERAKKFAEDLADKLRGERLGMLIFAGNAYLQTPLTVDYSALNIFIRSAHPDQVPTQGTAIGEVIALAERSFPPDNKRHKVLIIISDGENFDDDARDRAEKAGQSGMLIFTVGVGTAAGGFIPQTVNGRVDFKRDARGEPVRSIANEEELRRIASLGKGAYFSLSNTSESVLRALRQRIDAVEKREFEQQAFNVYESYFQYVIAVALLLLTIEFLITYTKNRFFSDKDLFRI